MTVHIRRAGPDDAETIHRFVKLLAEYEREPDAVEATPTVYREQLALDAPPFGCLIGEVDGAPAGIALYYVNYSTWRGRPGLYLEDIFVLEEHRRAGVARALMAALARMVVDEGYGRFEWSVLDWNRLAIDFYEKLGATPANEWILYRMPIAAAARLAHRAANADSR